MWILMLIVLIVSTVLMCYIDEHFGIVYIYPLGFLVGIILSVMMR